MTDYAEPRDELAERSLLGALLRLGKVPSAVAALVTPLDLWDPKHGYVAEVLWDLTARNVAADAVSVRAELIRRGIRGQASDGVWLVELLEAAGTDPLWLARHLRDIAVRRQVLHEAVRAQQLAVDPGSDPYDTAASLAVTASALSERDDPHRVPLTSLQSFLAGVEDYDWLIPGLLERGDRLVITGAEGSGKSIASHMLAICAAAGVHPFSGAHHEPLSVLRIDLENGARHLRRSLRPMSDHAAKIGRPVKRLHVESRPSGIDLTRPADETWLRAVCASAQPDLLVIGPMYRMHAANMNDEEPARAMTRVLDDLRSRHGCAMVLETHAPHAQGPGARALRPVGSSLFLRWPEFGYGLRPSAKYGDDVMDFVSWRGARDERDWPRQLVRGGQGRWPWIEFQPLTRWDESA